MFKIKTNVVNDNGVMRANVRNAVRGEIDCVYIEIQGQRIPLERKESGDWFAPLAVGTDGKVVNAKVELTLTIADYVAPKPRNAKPKEKEQIEIVAD